MTFGDFTGVFSRDFVVGFFLPAYAGLFSIWLLASSEFIPDALTENGMKEYSQTTQLLILGGFAVVVGLALSGVSYSIARLFEGYPLERRSSWPVVRSIYRGAIGLQRRRYDRLVTTRHDKASRIGIASEPHGLLIGTFRLVGSVCYPPASAMPFVHSSNTQMCGGDWTV